jgi:hypothetical protein
MVFMGERVRNDGYEFDVASKSSTLEGRRIANQDFMRPIALEVCWG